MIFFKKYFKLILIIFFSYFLSYFFGNKIFVGNTPKIKENLIAELNLEIKNFFIKQSDKILSFFSTKKNDNSSVKIEEFLKDVPFKEISKGVYSKSKDNYSILEIKINEIEFVEYSFNVEGKEIKIKIPKDTPPPSEEFVRPILLR